jgi:hypothetical protein
MMSLRIRFGVVGIFSVAISEILAYISIFGGINAIGCVYTDVVVHIKKSK